MATVTYTQHCIYCSLPISLEVDLEKLLRWQRGEFVQKVWPEKDDEWRAALSARLHAACQKEVFGCKRCGSTTGDCACYDDEDETGDPDRQWAVEVWCVNPDCEKGVINTYNGLLEMEARRMEEQWPHCKTDEDYCPACGVLGEAHVLDFSAPINDSCHEDFDEDDLPF